MATVRPAPSRTLSRTLDRSPLSGFDPWLALSGGILLVMGMMALYSVQQAQPATSVFVRQAMWLAVGIVPFCALWLAPVAFWRKLAFLLYLANVALLVLVLVEGREGGGAQRWLQAGPVQLQPSELSKLITVLTLSALFANRPGRERAFRTFALSFLHVAPPVALVFLQPHLGAALVLVAIWLAVCLAAGVRWTFLAGSILAGIALLAVAMTVPGILQEYQKERVRAMFVLDEKGADYQQLRASIAFGAGGVLGAGYLQGEQKAGRFIPEQHTDFIFTVVGEEGGLAGATLALAAFGFLFLRIWWVAYCAQDPYGRMIAFGLLGMFGFHAIANLGMNVGLLPVVGLWLPFMSYGGTALLLCLASLGLLLAVRREQLVTRF
jgi:rod shape determining protein RodA